MGFNELNSVEHYIIHQLTGVNLNSNEVAESQATYGAQWVFKTSNEILQFQKKNKSFRYK